MARRERATSRREAEDAVHGAGLDDDELIARINRLARLLDAEFSIFGFRFGLDGLIGLIPVFGDAATAILSFYLISEAIRAGAGPGLVARMVLNILIDLALGAIPFFGDIFDFAFRANALNARLLHEHLRDRAERSGGRRD